MLTDADAHELTYFVGLQWEPSDAAVLGPLIDAALVWAYDERLAEVAVPVVEALWMNELREDLERALAHSEQQPYVRRTLDAARADLALGPRRSLFARAVVEQGAFELAFAEQQPVHCLLCVDEALRATPQHERRDKALRIARIARRAAAVPEDELRAAVTNATLADGRDAAVAVARDDRRRAVRAWLQRIAELGSMSVPTLAAELLELAREPERPAEEDEVWRETVAGLIEQLAEPWN